MLTKAEINGIEYTILEPEQMLPFPLGKIRFRGVRLVRDEVETSPALYVLGQRAEGMGEGFLEIVVWFEREDYFPDSPKTDEISLVMTMPWEEVFEKVLIPAAIWDDEASLKVAVSELLAAMAIELVIECHEGIVKASLDVLGRSWEGEVFLRRLEDYLEEVPWEPGDEED